MTNKKAISVINAVKFILDNDQYSEEVEEALNMAIKALNCSEFPNSSDTICRQDAIKTAHLPTIEDAGYEVIRLDDILALPSAQPEKTEMIKEIRKWINSGNRGSADYFIVDKIEEIINKYE